MATRTRLVAVAAATLGLAFGAGFVFAQDVSGLLAQRKMNAVHAQQSATVVAQATPARQTPAVTQVTPETRLSIDTDNQALANGLTPVTLQDPNALPYVPQSGAAVLPPIRPSAAELRARAERDRARAERVRQEAAARPVFVAPAPRVERSNRICQTERCPNQNIIGIQY